MLVRRRWRRDWARYAAGAGRATLAGCGGQFKGRAPVRSPPKHASACRTRDLLIACYPLGTFALWGFAMAEAPKDLQDALAGRYTIEREIGRGGMATVYLAEDLKHHRPVAIKVLAPEIASLLGHQRFLQEIEVAARLTHPHILSLYDSGAAGGLLYYVMPYIKGESLRARLEREKQLPLEDALRITCEVADALAHAHQEGLIHRDIKPENILLSSGHALLADFGVARAIGEAGDTRLTASGIAIGTPIYMSPEQSLSSKDTDPRTDIYSLGCVLYEMLSGTPPFTGATAHAVQARHAIDPVPPLRTLRPGVPEGVEHAITRALAKVPADRFGTAEQMAQALEPAGHEFAGPSSPPVPQARPRVGWGRIGAISGAVVVIALVAIAAWQRVGPFSHRLGDSSSARPLKKGWILVAEFEGPPDDSSLAVTTRDLVSAALDQSEIVATVPRDQIRLALQMAGKPTNARVDAELARELAYRSAVHAVLEGKIGRLGQGYSVVLRVVDADTAKVILTENAVAKNGDALIPTLGRLAEKLRAGLGERRSAIQASRPMIAAATPSFEAYRLFVQAYLIRTSGHSRESIPVFRDALALDPDFASAWAGLAIAYYNIGPPDSALAATDKARRRPYRLTVVQRLLIEGLRAELDGDSRGALAAYERTLQYDPANRAALNAGGIVLGRLGRFVEALDWLRRAELASPFGAPRGNEMFSLASLGRVSEAREVARHLPQGPENDENLRRIEMAGTRWAAAESMAVASLADPSLEEELRANALLDLAMTQAARGAFRAAASTLERAEEIARGVPASISLYYHDLARRGRLSLTIASGGAIPLPPDRWAGDSSAATLLTRGLRASIAGDRAGAQQLLIRVRAGSLRELSWQGAAPVLLEARIEALAGRWAKAASTLQPTASQPLEIGNVEWPVGMSAVRWFLAEAFERLDQADSAAAYLERVVSDPAPALQEAQLRGAMIPFAHRRLVLLYARMGRVEDAKRHWKIFTETVRTPDPEIQPLIAEAREALAKAEKMAGLTGH